MPRKNPTLSFTATPDLKEQIESIAKASGSSRSKAIAGLVKKSLSEHTEPNCEQSENTQVCDHLLLEVELLNKALEEQANKANEAAQEIECLTAYYKAEINKLQEQIPEVPKFESKLKQLEAEKFFELLEFYEFSTQEEVFDESGEMACDLEAKDYWVEDCEESFVANFSRYQRFLSLADEVNEVLWQIDNSCSLHVMFGDMHDIWAIASKLIEYGLLQPMPHNPCSGLELWQYLQGIKNPNNVLAVVTHAFEDKRFDVIAAMLPWKPPIERGTYWRDYYSSCIGSEKVKGVWEWKGNPEAHRINEELSTVLSWEEPEFAVRWILESLAEYIQPFERTDILWDKGEETKRYYRDLFTQWHSDRLQELGQERLERCYSVVFGITWGDVDAVLNPIPSGAWWNIFGVSYSCNESELKAAYRTLAKRYHPDVNKSDAAKRAIQAINQAYEEGKVAIKSRTQYVGRSYSYYNDPRPEWQQCGYDSEADYEAAQKRMEEKLADIPF